MLYIVVIYIRDFSNHIMCLSIFVLINSSEITPPANEAENENRGLYCEAGFVLIQEHSVLMMDFLNY